VARSVSWCGTVAPGLALTEDKREGIIHRDLKPENVMIRMYTLYL